MNSKIAPCLSSNSIPSLPVIEKECIICHSKKMKNLGKHQEFEAWIIFCTKCGLIQTYPTPSNDELLEYYKKDFRSKRKDLKLNTSYIKQQDLLANSQYNFIVSSLRKKIHELKILEIGCSIGSLLKRFNDAGAETIGFEPDEKMCKYAVEMGLDVIPSSYEPNEITRHSIDGIILSHVLEHLPHPIETLDSFVELLKPSGFLFIEVPNENVERVCLRIAAGGTSAHLYFYNKINLLDLVSFQSFSLVRCVSCGLTTKYYTDYLRNLVAYKNEPFYSLSHLSAMFFFSRIRLSEIIWQRHPDIYSHPKFLSRCLNNDNLVALRGIWMLSK